MHTITKMILHPGSTARICHSRRSRRTPESNTMQRLQIVPSTVEGASGAQNGTGDSDIGTENGDKIYIHIHENRKKEVKKYIKKTKRIK